MAASTLSIDYSPALWRRQILAHRDPKFVEARSGFVAASFIGQARASSAFVDIQNLRVVLLYEEVFHSFDEPRPNRSPLRLMAYRASRVPHGIQWGGTDNSQLFKDLTLTPQFGPHGQRIDRSKFELLSLALKLNRRLSRAARYPAAPWPNLRLPCMWAGVRRMVARDLLPEGPEFEEARRQSNSSATALFHTVAQYAFGLVLYPMDWVSNQLEHARAMFAEVTPSLQRQVFRVDGLPDGLIGCQGASAFDFYNSRYRRVGRDDTTSGDDETQTMPTPPTDGDAAESMQTVGCVA